MAHSPTNIHQLISRTGTWNSKADFYEALNIYATRVDVLDKDMLENECLKWDVIRAAHELLSRKENPLAD